MKIVRSNQLEWAEAINRGKFSGRRKELGGDKLSCGLWELPPGKRSFPFHLHHVTEEALFVVSGRAKVRGKDVEQEIGPGDFVSFPIGTPHQLINDGKEPMVYVAMSAVFGADVVEYPDSKKVACMIGKFPDRKRWIFRESEQPDYFEGED